MASLTRRFQWQGPKGARASESLRYVAFSGFAMRPQRDHSAQTRWSSARPLISNQAVEPSNRKAADMPEHPDAVQIGGRLHDAAADPTAPPTVVHVGTRLRDASVDPRPGDNPPGALTREQQAAARSQLEA